jgi:hypothetical protein
VLEEHRGPAKILAVSHPKGNPAVGAPAGAFCRRSPRGRPVHKGEPQNRGRGGLAVTTCVQDHQHRRSHHEHDHQPRDQSRQQSAYFETVAVVIRRTARQISRTKFDLRQEPAGATRARCACRLRLWSCIGAGSLLFAAIFVAARTDNYRGAATVRVKLSDCYSSRTRRWTKDYKRKVRARSSTYA